MAALDVGYFADGRILPLNGALDLLRLDILPFQDRIRIGLVTAYLQRVRDWKPFDKSPRSPGCEERWVIGYEATFGAQLEAKFGRYASDIAMVWFWGKIWLRTTSRRSLPRGEKLGYPLGSFGSVIDAIAAAARAQGAMLNTGAGPSELNQVDGARWRMSFEEGIADQEYDRSSSPPHRRSSPA